jgi:hypothetical protein
MNEWRRILRVILLVLAALNVPVPIFHLGWAGLAIWLLSEV